MGDTNKDIYERKLREAQTAMIDCLMIAIDLRLFVLMGKIGEVLISIKDVKEMGL